MVIVEEDKRGKISKDSKQKITESLDDYVIEKTDIWKFKTIFTSSEIDKIDKKKDLTFFDVTQLFLKKPQIFFLDSSKKYLFSYQSELFEHDFGQLFPINGITAFYRYGIDTLEKTVEKGYVKL